MPVYKTVSLTEKEHKAITKMIARYETGYMNRLRMLGGMGKYNFERAVQKLYNSQTVHLNNSAR